MTLNLEAHTEYILQSYQDGERSVMEVDITCWDDAGYGEQYNFQFQLPKNTKRAKIALVEGAKGNDSQQIILEEIEFYEEKS